MSTKQEQLRSLAQELTELADIAEPTEAQTLRFAEATEEFDTLEVEAEAEIKRDATISRAKAALETGEAVTEPGDANSDAVPQVTRQTRTAPVVRSKVADLTDLDTLPRNWDGPAQLRSELRSRAIGVVELNESLEDDNKETAIKRFKPSADEQAFMRVLRTASPEYEDEFRMYLRSGQPGPEMVRASFTEGVPASGGYMVPFHLDPTIILTNDGRINPMRGLADTVTLQNTNIWHGVATDGVTAEYVGESVEVAAATATFSQPTITAFKADVYMPASMELLQDSTFGQQIPMLIQDARDEWEANEFVLGAGSTAAIEGLVTKLAATAASVVSATTNASFGSPDVFKLANALPPRYRSNSTWIGEQSIFNLVRQFNVSGQPSGAFWTDLGPARPSQLLGRDVAESSVMYAAPLHTATSSNDNILVLGDIRKCYKIVDRMGMEIQYDPMVLGSNRRPTGEVAWVAFWRQGGGVVNSNAARLLQV